MPHRFQVDPERAISALRDLVEKLEEPAAVFALGDVDLFESDPWALAKAVLKEAAQLAEYERTHQDDGGEG